MFHLKSNPRLARSRLPGEVGDPGVGGGLLGHRDGPRGALVHHGVEATQELHRVQVLPPPVAVHAPVALRPGVVEPDHGGHGVHPEAVHVELLQPEAGAPQEEVAHLGPAVVEDVGTPDGVLPDARVGVLVEGRPVEAAQPVPLLGEVRRHPVQEHPQVVGVAGVHKRLQVLRRPVAGRGGVVPRDQVPPGGVGRVLGHRHQLHVGVAQVAHVGGQVPGQLAVGQGPVALLRDAAPGAGVHLVDGEGPVGPLAPGAPGHPVPVRPGEGAQGGEVVDHGGGAGGGLATEGVGVGLVRGGGGAPGDQAVLVVLPRSRPGDEGLPDARRPPPGHGLPALRPAVEVAPHGDGDGVGGPDGEACPGYPVPRQGVRPQALVGTLEGALGQQIEVVLAQHPNTPL